MNIYECKEIHKEGRADTQFEQRKFDALEWLIRQYSELQVTIDQQAAKIVKLERVVIAAQQAGHRVLIAGGDYGDELSDYELRKVLGDAQDEIFKLFGHTNSYDYHQALKSGTLSADSSNYLAEQKAQWRREVAQIIRRYGIDWQMAEEEILRMAEQPKEK